LKNFKKFNGQRNNQQSSLEGEKVGINFSSFNSSRSNDFSNSFNFFSKFISEFINSTKPKEALQPTFISLDQFLLMKINFLHKIK
jgi:hypothetical protein